MFARATQNVVFNDLFKSIASAAACHMAKYDRWTAVRITIIIRVPASLFDGPTSADRHETRANTHIWRKKFRSLRLDDIPVSIYGRTLGPICKFQFSSRVTSHYTHVRLKPYLNTIRAYDPLKIRNFTASESICT